MWPPFYQSTPYIWHTTIHHDMFCETARVPMQLVYNSIILQTILRDTVHFMG